MEMNEIGMLSFSFLLGVSAGIIFFLGLRWTVSLSTSMKYPVFLFFLSFLIRALVLLSIFYWFGDGRFERFALLLLGFILSKKFCVRQRKIHEHNS